MNTITLPDQLNLEHSEAVQVFNYCSSQDISKQQIILNQNTFSFLIEGTKEVVFDNSTLSINNSKFLIMKAGHCLMSEKLSTVQNYNSVLLFFSNEILLKYIEKNEAQTHQSAKHKSVYAFDYDSFIHGFVQSLLGISKLTKDIQKKLLAVKFEEIILYLTALHGTDFLYALCEKTKDTSKNFIKTVETNYLSKLTLKELSFLSNMSISTFKREFKKHYNESPIKWFQNKRLEHAHYLLNQEQKTATEIYFEMGYENLSSFIQAYKSKYGRTPKQNSKK